MSARARQHARALLRPVYHRLLVRLFGRSAVPYRGTAGLEGFLQAARAEWPQATVVLLPPFPREQASPVAKAIEARVRADALAAAHRAGAKRLDVGGVLAGPKRLRCANGYNLNTEGSRLVGECVADWIRRDRQEADSARDASPVPR